MKRAVQCGDWCACHAAATDWPGVIGAAVLIATLIVVALIPG